jgi:hypothetical protein
MYEQSKTAVRAQRRAAARAHNSDIHGAPEAAPRLASTHVALLAGHLAALLSATEEVRQSTEEPGQQAELDAALGELRVRLAQLAPAGTPPQAVGGAGSRSLAPAHEHAHALAGRLLVVAAAQQDTTTAVLACRRMDAHAAARSAL